MEILLDTNFIINCIKYKIDFNEMANQIIDTQITWLVPQQVLNELGAIKDTKGNKKEHRQAADLAFQILQTVKHKVIELGRGRNVDIAIVNYILDKPITLATMDKNLKSRVPNNKILTIRGKTHLELI
ncbi:MAG: rRNA-processing protein FCF1 [Patescibacteria group bacterium]|jgi:rRNA-processing protein FCF1